MVNPLKKKKKVGLVLNPKNKIANSKCLNVYFYVYKMKHYVHVTHYYALLWLKAICKHPRECMMISGKLYSMVN